MFLSIMYFIVIPIIPDRKQNSIVMAIIIPILAFSFVLNRVDVATPKDNPESAPHRDVIITYKRFFP